MKGTLLGNSQRKAEIHRNCLFFRCPLQCHGLGTTMPRPVCSMVQWMGGSVSRLWLITPRDPQEEAGKTEELRWGAGPCGEAWEAPKCAHGLSSPPTLKLTLSDRSLICALSRNLRLSTHCSRALVYLSRLPALSLVPRVSLSSHPTPSCLLELV